MIKRRKGMGLSMKAGGNFLAIMGPANVFFFNKESNCLSLTV